MNCALVLPTQNLLETNLVTAENCVQFCPSVQKLFIIFSYTDARTDRHTNSVQNESPLYPIRVQAEKFSTLFFYLSQNGVSLLSSLTPFCLNKRAKSMDCSIITITFFTIYIFSITITYMVALNHSPFSIDDYICH